jgi:hypothetical protein
MNACRGLTQVLDPPTEISWVERGLLPSGKFELIVVFTKTQRTLQTLGIARRLARGLGGRVRLLVPHIVPYPLPLEKPPVSAVFPGRRFRAVIGDSIVESRVDIRLCRNRWQMLEQALAPGSLIVLVVPNTRWPSVESRLARRLEAAGHNVVSFLQKRVKLCWISSMPE